MNRFYFTVIIITLCVSSCVQEQDDWQMMREIEKQIVAPTFLDILGLSKPKEMTGKSLLRCCY